MKKFLLFLLAAFMWTSVIIAQSSGGVSQAEYAALVDLYNATNGSNWTNKTNWKTGNVSNWIGVTVEDGHVTKLKLPENNLEGPIPSSIGNLQHLIEIDFDENNLSGSIPA